MQLLMKWFISAVAVFLTANLLPGAHVDSFTTALIVALVLGVINAIIKPILFILTIPITIVTLGLFGLILNTLMILITDWLIKGFRIDNFWWALLFSLVLSVISSFLHQITKE
jgi:putative membrane protein